MANMLSEVWFVPAQGGASIRVGLNSDGSADLSALPDDIRRSLEDFGTRDELHRGNVKAGEGTRFLALLVANATGYANFTASRPAASPTVSSAYEKITW